MKIQCLHCLKVLPAEPQARFLTDELVHLHVGRGQPHFADPGVVGAIMVHSQEHEPRAWLEGRDYALVDDDQA